MFSICKFLCKCNIRNYTLSILICPCTVILFPEFLSIQYISCALDFLSRIRNSFSTSEYTNVLCCNSKWFCSFYGNFTWICSFCLCIRCSNSTGAFLYTLYQPLFINGGNLLIGSFPSYGFYSFHSQWNRLCFINRNRFLVKFSRSLHRCYHSTC